MRTFRSLLRTSSGATLAVVTAVLLALTAVLPVLPSQIVSAQATISTTTLASAVGADTNAQTSTIVVASATGITAGRVIYVDREAMRVLPSYSSGTTIPVQRGVLGTTRTTHASGAVVYHGPDSYFTQAEPSGSCTLTAEVATPRIVITSGNVYQCAGSVWKVLKRGGYPDFGYPSLANGGTAYTASGAITIEPGFVFLSAGSALAMTLADPTTDQNGMVMCIITMTAQAHTVTYTAGFGGGTTARDVATFTAAINNGFCIVARSGVWYPVPGLQGVAIA